MSVRVGRINCASRRAVQVRDRSRRLLAGSRSEMNPAVCRVRRLWRRQMRRLYRPNYVDRDRPRVDPSPLENPACHLTSHVLVTVHLLNSIDRALQPRVGNDAMFIVLPVGRRGRGIAQLLAADRQRNLPLKWYRHDARTKTRAKRAASRAGIGLAAVRGKVCRLDVELSRPARKPSVAMLCEVVQTAPRDIHRRPPRSGVRCSPGRRRPS